MTGVPKHATSSVFLLRPVDTGWLVGLIHHRRFQRWMLPGGHVEAWENSAEAAIREVGEETGVVAQLLCLPGIGRPADVTEPEVPAPLWIVEEHVPAEPRQPQSHIHIDHLYVAVATGAVAATDEPLRFGWFAPARLDELTMFTGTRERARHLLRRLSDPEASPRLVPAADQERPARQDIPEGT